MRTKALLLAAAFAAAGVATSMAQAVYSVNAVGYVNTTLVPGFQLVSNPLNAADNKIETLFSNMQGGVRDGTTVYKFTNGQFKIVNYIEAFAAGLVISVRPPFQVTVFSSSCRDLRSRVKRLTRL